MAKMRMHEKNRLDEDLLHSFPPHKAKMDGSAGIGRHYKDLLPSPSAPQGPWEREGKVHEFRHGHKY